jgi:hypothetical protein
MFIHTATKILRSFLLCWLLFFVAAYFIFLYNSFQRASREEMAAAAGPGAADAYPKSESQQSGLVGNIHGQDVEAAKAVY